MLKERAVPIGRPVPLAAIVTEPATFDSAKPAVLLLNSGVMHHVGACRLTVKVARDIAARGLLALRFDFAGLGDSAPRSGAAAQADAAQQQLAEVMDYLQRSRGVNSFVLYGLCSGAMASFRMACHDERVVGIAQIDGYSYRTWRFHYEHYRRRIFRRGPWLGLLRRLSGRHASQGEPAAPVAFREVPTFDPVPPRDEVAAGLRKIVGRGVRVFACFTGGDAGYNYASQYRDCFRDVDFGDTLHLTYVPEANHIVTNPHAQAEIVSAIGGWMEQIAATPAANRGRDAGRSTSHVA
jgi:dienelactone hydrolase